MNREYFELLWSLCEWPDTGFIPGPEILTDIPQEYYELWEEQGIIRAPSQASLIHIPEHGIVGFPRRVLKDSDYFFCVYDNHGRTDEKMVPAAPGSRIFSIFRERLAFHMAQQWGIDFEYQSLHRPEASLVGYRNKEIPIVIINRIYGMPIGQALEIKGILNVRRSFIITIAYKAILTDLERNERLAPNGIIYVHTLDFLTEDGFPRWIEAETEHFRARLINTPWDYDKAEGRILF